MIPPVASLSLLFDGFGTGLDCVGCGVRIRVARIWATHEIFLALASEKRCKKKVKSLNQLYRLYCIKKNSTCSRAYKQGESGTKRTRKSGTNKDTHIFVKAMALTEPN